MSVNIDNLTGTESLDELEAMLAEIEKEPDSELIDDTGTVQTDVEPAPSAGKVAAGNEQAQDQQGSENEAQAEKAILAKNGQHTIPYEVLEQARNEAKQLREQLTQAQQAQAERDKLQALLEKNGIDPNADPNGLSQEDIESMTHDFPEIGKVVLTLNNKIQELETKQAATPVINAQDDVQEALAASPDLLKWRDVDQDRFDFAVAVDEKLKAAPEWQGKTLKERFAEAERRTKAAFGDVLEQQQQQQQAKAPAKEPGKAEEKPADFIPSSPSEIGQSHQAPATGLERYGAMSQAELIGEMSNMTDAQIEALLEQSGY